MHRHLTLKHGKGSKARRASAANKTDALLNDTSREPHRTPNIEDHYPSANGSGRLFEGSEQVQGNPLPIALDMGVSTNQPSGDDRALHMSEDVFPSPAFSLDQLQNWAWSHHSPLPIFPVDAVQSMQVGQNEGSHVFVSAALLFFR